jgi:hypothetical protein
MAFRRLSGSARNYLNTETGEAISYRQYRRIYERGDEYRPLSLPDLARRRAKQAQYNRLVGARHKGLQAQALARLDTSQVGLVEAAKRERDTLRGVSKAEIMRDPGFKSDIQELKRLNKKSIKRLTRAELAEYKDILERLGLREGIPRGVTPGDSDAWRSGMMRRARNGRVVPIRRDAGRPRQKRG